MVHVSRSGGVRALGLLTVCLPLPLYLDRLELVHNIQPSSHFGMRLCTQSQKTGSHAMSSLCLGACNGSWLAGLGYRRATNTLVSLVARLADSVVIWRAKDNSTTICNAFWLSVVYSALRVSQYACC